MHRCSVQQVECVWSAARRRSKQWPQVEHGPVAGQQVRWFLFVGCWFVARHQRHTYRRRRPISRAHHTPRGRCFSGQCLSTNEGIVVAQFCSKSGSILQQNNCSCLLNMCQSTLHGALPVSRSAWQHSLLVAQGCHRRALEVCWVL